MDCAFGHDVGDRALVEIAQRIRKVLGPKRRLYRIGGAEFAVILSGSPADSAVLMAERLRERISEQNVEGDALPAVTASFDVAELDDDLSNQDAWLKCADIALYVSKSNGRIQATGNRTLSGVALPDSPSARKTKKHPEKPARRARV